MDSPEQSAKLSSIEIGERLLLDEKEREKYIKDLQTIIESDGSLEITPSFLENTGFDLSIVSNFFRDGDVSKNNISVYIRYKSISVQDDPSLALAVNKTRDDILIRGYYSNDTRYRPVNVQGVVDILGIFDELICQATADHYRQPVTREEFFPNSKLIEKFENRGFRPRSEDQAILTKRYSPSPKK